MRCMMCNKNCRCSCKWGWCPSCNSSNKQIAVMNDLLKFWITKDNLKKQLNEVKKYVDRIDTYTLYEFIAWIIDEEKFTEALHQFKPQKPKQFEGKKSEVVDTTWRVNPDRLCVFKWNSPWDRCVYCNSIRKYMKGLECPKYANTLGTTVPENE